MKFSPVPLSKAQYLNFIFFEAKVGGLPVTTMFDTRGNTLIKESLANKIDLTYIDKTPIDVDRGWKRARVNLVIGGLEIGSAPVVVAKDETFDIMVDPAGNKFPADMILGWNIISQLAFRGDLRSGTLEIQVDDFKEPSSKDKPNTPILYIEFAGERMLAAIDSSSPITTVSQDVFDKIVSKNAGGTGGLEMFGLGDENLTYETALKFKIDEDEITLKGAQLNPKLNEGNVEIVFGADLLRNTTWAMYNPQRYIRAKQ